jgi:signal transduction histidine kinase
VSLRTYIALISSLVVFGVLCLLYAQTQAILKTVFTRLDDIHAKAVLSTTQGIVKAYAYRLKTYRTLLENDNRLSSAFLVSREKGKLPFEKQLLDLRKQFACDRLEVEYRHQAQPAVTQITTDSSDPELSSTSTLRNFGEVVGKVTLAYSLNGTIAKEIEATMGAPVHFFAKLPNPPTHPEANRIYQTLALPLNDSPVMTQLIIEVDSQYIAELNRTSRREMTQVAIGSLILLLLILYGLLELGFLRRFKPLLSSIQSVASDLDRGTISQAVVIRQPIREVDDLARSFGNFTKSLESFQKRVEEKSREAAFFELAEQVAHDLKSPLAAMEMSLAMNKSPETSTATSIRLCLERIRQIIRGLYKQPESETGSATWLRPLLGEIWSEKRAQYAESPGISLRLVDEENTQALFVDLPAIDLSRVLSNLIDNGVQALDGSGFIEISTSEQRELNVCRIIVRDSGRGIPSELIPKLGRRGVTFNKPGGSGLGLYDARQLIESVGGKLGIDSEPGRGTVVTLLIPTVATPTWLAVDLEFPENIPLVLLDDDPTIPELWRSRLPKALIPQLLVFESIDAFNKWESMRSDEFIFLCDYKLGANGRTGLDVLQSLSPKCSKYLVTSHNRSPEVLAAVRRSNIKMIPKEWLGFITIHTVKR